MVNDRPLLARFPIEWNTINHVVDSLGSKMNRMPRVDAVAGTAGLARDASLLFLGGQLSFCMVLSFIAAYG